jgi:hypothetical protein
MDAERERKSAGSIAGPLIAELASQECDIHGAGFTPEIVILGYSMVPAM